MTEERLDLTSIPTEDARIVLRGLQVAEGSDLMVDHPRQPAEYVHVDGTLWEWHGRWRVVGGVHVRAYDLVTSSTEST